jgi:hypothetical protein
VRVVSGRDVTDEARTLEGAADLTLVAAACPTGLPESLPESRIIAIRAWASRSRWAAAQLARSSWAGELLGDAKNSSLKKEAPPRAPKGSPQGQLLRQWGTLRAGCGHTLSAGAKEAM